MKKDESWFYADGASLAVISFITTDEAEAIKAEVSMQEDIVSKALQSTERILLFPCGCYFEFMCLHTANTWLVSDLD